MADQDALLTWLSANGLEKYHSVFLENDIDTIELVLSLTSEELKELGVSLGDRKRFQNLASPSKSYGDFEKSVMETYPYVIAYPFRRMLDEEDGRNRMELLSYVLLNTLKLTGLVIASDYFQSPIRSARLNELFRSNLFQPSMGHWNAFIREAITILKGEGMQWAFPSLVDAYEAVETSSRSKKYATETEYTDVDGLLQYRESKMTAIGTLINFRNRYLGHGMPLSKEEYTRLYAGIYPVLTDLLKGLGCLERILLFRNDSSGYYLLQGDAVRQTDPDLSIPLDSDIHVSDGDGRRMPLLPFYIVPGKFNAGKDDRAQVLVYEQNTTQRVIFYSPESVKAEVTGEILERLHLTLAEKEREAPYAPGQFSGTLRDERLASHNARMLDGLQRETKVIEGVYQNRFDAELALMGWAGSSSGFFFLAAEAGSGKTNLLAHLVSRYNAIGYPTVLLRANRMSTPDLAGELRKVLNLQEEHPIGAYPYLIGTQDRPLMVLIDGGNESPDPMRLLQSALDLAVSYPGGGLKMVMSWRVNDLNQVPHAEIMDMEVLFPAARRTHPNPLAGHALLLQAMSLVETEGAWKAYVAHPSKRYRPRFDFQELLLQDRPMALELSNPLLLRLFLELFHDKGMKAKSQGFTNLWRNWWEGIRRQPREGDYLLQLARFLAQREKSQASLDELFDDASLSAAVNNLQIDSPHRQLIRKGVLSQYLQDGILQVGFTMEASFHYLLSMELTPGNIRERVQGSPFWEAPARYRLWEAAHTADDGLLFELIDDIHFPNHLTAFALAQYIVLHGPGKALERLLMEPTEQDWEAISLAAKQLRDSRPREYRLLADTFLERVLQQGYPVSSDRLASFLLEAQKALADAIHESFIREHPPLSVEGMKSLAEYHAKYGRNREALACLQRAVDHPL